MRVHGVILSEVPRWAKVAGHAVEEPRRFTRDGRWLFGGVLRLRAPHWPTSAPLRMTSWRGRRGLRLRSRLRLRLRNKFTAGLGLVL